MRFAIIYSKQNIAGTNIVEQFKKLAYAPQVPIIETKKQTIFLKQTDLKKYPELRNIDFLVFASTHKSVKGNPSLSLHAPGNWRGADLGGEEGKVSMTSAFILKYLFQELEKNAEEAGLKGEYEVTLECTHHGPSINIPCGFIEVGSGEEQWKDLRACRIVAKTILSLQDYKPNKDWIPSIGIGGPHYCPNFNKIQLNSEYAISHIIPQYALPLTQSMFQEAEQKTSEHVKNIIIDWKGCGKSEERTKYIEMIEKFGVEIKRTSEVEK